MLQEFKDIQQDFMINPIDNYLSMQEKVLQELEDIHSTEFDDKSYGQLSLDVGESASGPDSEPCVGVGNILGSKISCELDSVWR